MAVKRESANILLANDPDHQKAIASAISAEAEKGNGAKIKNCSETQIQAMLGACNENTEISYAFGFNGEKPRYLGDGLASHLKRITGSSIHIGAHTIKEEE